MQSTRLIKIAGKSILKNKLRTLLTMLGIIIGVGAVIVMVAVGQGAKSEIQRRIDSLGTNMIVITQGAFRQGGVSQGAGTSNRLTIKDYNTLAKQGLLLTATSPVINAPGQVVGGAGNWRTSVNGVSTDYQLIRDWGTSAGRFFDAADQRANRRVAVIGQTVATNLWPDQDPVGQEVRLRNVPFQVIGVLDVKGQGAAGNDQDDIILCPYTTVQTRLSGHQFISQIIASTATKEQITPAENEITQILRETHRLAPYDSNDFSVRNQTDLVQAASGTTDVMTAAARRHRRHLAARRRHRHHEHHARVGHRADARDRHPHGDRRAGQRRADAVPGRGDRDERDRRDHRRGVRVRGGGDPAAQHGVADGDRAAHGGHRHRLLGGGGHLLRLLPGAQGGGARSHPGAAVRIAGRRPRAPAARGKERRPGTR